VIRSALASLNIAEMQVDDSDEPSQERAYEVVATESITIAIEPAQDQDIARVVETGIAGSSPVQPTAIEAAAALVATDAAQASIEPAVEFVMEQVALANETDALSAPIQSDDASDQSLKSPTKAPETDENTTVKTTV